jgi:chorismate mutase
MTRAVRGAIQVAENTATSIEQAGSRLVKEILKLNGIAENHIVSIVLSMTEDLTAANPATGLRQTGFAATPLFCVQEARIVGALPRVIRALVTWESPGRRAPVPVYLDGADVLRPDLARGNPPAAAPGNPPAAAPGNPPSSARGSGE